jgi:hypothetical protein
LFYEPRQEEPTAAVADRPPLQEPTLEDRFDLGLSSLSIGISDVELTVSEEFEGTKGRFGLQHAFVRETDSSAGAQTREENLKYLVDAQLEVGDSDSDLQYAAFAFTYSADQDTRALKKDGKVRPVRDQFELGKLIASFDDTLGLDYYYELRAVQVGRHWAYRPSTDSPLTFTVALRGSLGWAWAESEDDQYDSMSNMTMGFLPAFTAEHRRLGRLYADYRIVNGFDIGNPTGTYSRLGYVRLGYRLALSRRYALDVFFAKRSFNVSDSEQADLYTKTRLLGIELAFGLQ